MEKFLRREVDKVSVLYTHFVNTISQRTLVQTLLPISSFDLPKSEAGESGGQAVDPMVGYMSDHTRTRLGRRHPYLYGVAVPLALAVALLWAPPTGMTHSSA